MEESLNCELEHTPGSLGQQVDYFQWQKEAEYIIVLIFLVENGEIY